MILNIDDRGMGLINKLIDLALRGAGTNALPHVNQFIEYFESNKSDGDVPSQTITSSDDESKEQDEE